MKKLRDYEEYASHASEQEYLKNLSEINTCISQIIRKREYEGMKLNAGILGEIRAKYGEAFYLLDSVQFRENWRQLLLFALACLPFPWELGELSLAHSLWC